jgi:cytochrome c peroxidase
MSCAAAVLPRQQHARPQADLVVIPDGPIKTLTLRGIKDSPPYLHDGRLLTLADTVEFFNVVLSLKLTQPEKDALLAYLLTL